jgi:hypothetical protein
VISVAIQESIYSDIIKSMQTDNAPWVIPKGMFYLLNHVIVPFTPQPTVIRIETDRVGEPINILVDQIGEFGSGVDVRSQQTTYTVVAQSSVITKGIQLGRGRNLITVQVQSRPDDVAYLIINATSIVAMWEAFARVLYSVSTRIIDEQKSAISSDLATRLIEPFISFQDLLPDIQSLKILTTRLVTKGLIHSVGTRLGVNELTKALTLTTPVFKNMDKDTFDLYPALDPWTCSASQFGGQEAHVWLPNIGITSWLAFLSFISSQPDLYNIISVTENEVVVEYQGDIQRHNFDFDQFGTDFLVSQATTECFKSIVVTASMQSIVTVRMCAAAYTFDLYITSDTLLGDCRGNFDTNRPFDNNCPFDADPIDPFTDGWVDLSLTGRFEQDYPYTHTLDTFIVPSTAYTGSLCGYEGYYTQLIANHKYEIDVPVDITVNGYIQKALGFILESPNGTRWDIRVNASNQTLKSTSGTLAPINLYKVTKPDMSEASFAIENDGTLKVVSPPSGGETLMNTLYIQGDDVSVWWITVDNDNVIKVTQIFPV